MSGRGAKSPEIPPKTIIAILDDLSLSPTQFEEKSMWKFICQSSPPLTHLRVYLYERHISSLSHPPTAEYFQTNKHFHVTLSREWERRAKANTILGLLFELCAIVLRLECPEESH